jgi:hypothetical protein
MLDIFDHNITEREKAHHLGLLVDRFLARCYLSILFSEKNHYTLIL